MNEITLDKIPIGKTVTIKEILVNSNFKLRLLEIGIIPNSHITPLFKSPINDPVAYLVNGSVISLRKQITSNIKVI